MVCSVARGDDTLTRRDWEYLSLCLGRFGQRMWLKPGAIQYLWVVRKESDRWQVSLWSGNLYWLRLDGLIVKPDLDLGTPVVRRIGSGHIAQYYRFERPMVLQ